jgi:hypothetical protein
LVYFFEKLATGSNQCGKEHSDQPVENCEQSKKCSDQPEEQLPMEHDRDHVLNNEHRDVDKNTDNSQNKEVVLLEKPEVTNNTYHPICLWRKGLVVYMLLSYCLVLTLLVVALLVILFPYFLQMSMVFIEF